MSERQRIWYKNNKEDHLRKNKLWRDSNKQKIKDSDISYRATSKGRAAILLCGVRSRAKIKQLDYDLNTEWLASKIGLGICAVTGLPFDMTGSGKHPFAPSIDRIDSSKGYTKDNCQVVVFIYNTAKQEFKHEDVLKMCSAIISTDLNRMR